MLSLLHRTAIALSALLIAPSMLPQPVAAAPATTETIVLIRHGEKPPLGLGQLDCRGLNRALALPAVLAKAFGKPKAIFAPNPAIMKEDSGVLYDYIRPLATIEPTAIAFGLPINTSIGFSDVAALEGSLGGRGYWEGLIFVAWEHHKIVELARRLMADNGGAPASIPDWAESDFDSIYILTIIRSDEHATTTFEHRREGLDGQPVSCPH